MTAENKGSSASTAGQSRNKTDGKSENTQKKNREKWPWGAQFVLALVALLVLVGLIVLLPIYSASKLSVNGVALDAVKIWTPMLSVLIALTTMTISGIFIFMTFRIDRGTKREAKTQARKKARKVAETVAKTKLDETAEQAKEILNAIGLTAKEAAAEVERHKENANRSAGSAQESAGSAQKSARSAQESAGSAQESAGSAQKSARSAQESAGSAQKSARSAQESAGSAQKSARSAQESAGSAQKSARSAQESAGSAENSAGSAQESAGSAENSAGSAQESAGSAENSAGSAQESAGSADRSARAAEESQRASNNVAEVIKNTKTHIDTDAAGVAAANDEVDRILQDVRTRLPAMVAEALGEMTDDQLQTFAQALAPMLLQRPPDEIQEQRKGRRRLWSFSRR